MFRPSRSLIFLISGLIAAGPTLAFARSCVPAGSECSYEQYATLLGASENGGKYDGCNRLGYCGKYQMGGAALVEAGIIERTGNYAQNDTSKYVFTATAQANGVNSIKDFQGSGTTQELAQKNLLARQVTYANTLGLTKFVGSTTADGTVVTMSGITAAIHLGGAGNALKYLKGEGNFGDANGTKISSYMQCFGGCSLPGQDAMKAPEQPDGGDKDGPTTAQLGQCLPDPTDILNNPRAVTQPSALVLPSTAPNVITP
jgi:hypothetical protein